MAEIDQRLRRFIGALLLVEAEIDVDRLVGRLEGLHHRHAGAFQEVPRMFGLIDADDDDRFGMLAEQVAMAFSSSASE